MTSLTYFVSRYHDRTALSVFVSLHITHPVVSLRRRRDKALASRSPKIHARKDAPLSVVGVRRGIVYDEIDEYIDGLANRGDATLKTVERQGEAEGWPIV